MKIRQSFSCVLVFLVFLTLQACKSEKKSRMEEIAELQEAWELRRNPDTTKILVQLYYEFQEKYPDDTMSASYIRRAGVVAEYFGNYPEAIDALELVIKTYPKYSRITKAYSDLGRLYETVDDVENARRVYTEFLEKFPENEDAGNIRYALMNLGQPQAKIKQDLLTPKDSVAAAE